MLLSIDIGNTFIKFAVFNDSDEILQRFSLSSYPARSSDEYELLIRQFLSSSDLCVDAVVISSVVPSLTSPISTAANNITSSRPFFIGAGTHTGFKIKINDSSELGSDIVANTAAALKIISPPFVIVDMGTATTLTVIDKFGDVVGTIIHPGISVSQKSLSNSAAQLYDVTLLKPKKLIGQNSAESIQSGLINGHICMIDGLISCIRREICSSDGLHLSIVATGDFADYVIPYCSEEIMIVPDLTLRGNTVLFRMNRRS